MKTILVPTDFSKNATNALNYALALAKKEKAGLLLFHAYSIPYVSPDIPMEYYAEQLKDTEYLVNQLLAALRDRVKKSGKVECEILSRQGSGVDAILDMIKKKKISMVVMGTKGASGIKAALIGSNTARVIVKSSKPVIAVPENAKFEGLKKIVFATDYRAGDIGAIGKLTKPVRPFKSALQLIHIADRSDISGRENELMKKFADRVSRKIDYGRISGQVLQFP